MKLHDLLDLQHQLQVEAYGIDPPHLTDQERAWYLTWNAFALEDELHELMAEFQWKPWAKDIGTIKNRDRALVEYVDMLHFFLNIALAFDFTGQEIVDAYTDKLQVNVERQTREGGYDASGTKCPGCKRDLGEVGTKTVNLNFDGIGIQALQCAGCGWELDRAVR